MSRIGDAPILISEGITIEKDGRSLVVNGPKGSLRMEISPDVKVEIQGNQIKISRTNDLPKIKAMHGLTRNLIANMITGVKEGWSKDLELVGVGFRAAGGGNKLTLNIGFSHPVEIDTPEGISFEVSDNTKIKVSGIDKQLVGQVTANIRSIKPPDVYKGKGIRYQGEYVRKKIGKAGKVGAGVGTAGGGK
ncbi:50S ribosomal protein L6 [Candidatus Daviesbacteria bacterium RIFCSPLOWO2_01_FULL_39_12]|uniref:Large ribosomal subunit protein uL6 n=1 Tax=Candidatus Daviesbacteria bacterium RIFCSPLOWO2_01_FULL_39_12 TaxID=1797785 RepID=A0A1F5KLF4_9BACT|nr:MAG: 50S ribosomal protein L6 [Candidatus Daviesbacteria bacterium RIFCSPHIGHO2_02_FULL_39_8]OGE41694.1 MAG: 50S ribosomal protein L6 [Candidatus Daviesbacteria bacterium RIFCSPLOWO2_01_FULL_39_12]